MQPKQEMDIETSARLLKLLGDKTRLSMVKIMSEYECCVCEFTDLFDMSQPAISQHLKKLKDAGAVSEARRGQWIFYSLNQDSSYYGFISNIIRDLPKQSDKLEKIEKQGKRIACCK
ncbi:transcriptional regulator, ArsR family [Bacillus sp. OV322]|uniref:ArsR/SmtB family transcription factor n=1 Tax=Bacillus sp. OV322 TaxID=1882764 RepID=UPI0008EB4DB2|nr:metalloregulator ArsR/SmtB family transcription factor [Bacillus sp. OV322]SFC95300.1 transcriptional regulator, ArsR family [Bacillus sp. OV322]